MLSLINLLILFFIVLIIYQIFLAYIENNIIEGLTNQQYQPYDTNNPNNALILAQQNAGNISVLKEQIDELNGLNKEVQDISGNVITLQGQVSQMLADAQQKTNQMTGGSAPNVTGAVSSS
jgi:peptidoglycan hydrolase CwlO-like protein